MHPQIESRVLSEDKDGDSLMGRRGQTDPLTDAERALLTLLFKKYRASLYRHLIGLVSSRDDAAELVQECYARLLRHSDVARFDDVARGYLFRTATNLARDHFRRRRSHRTDLHVDIDGVPLPADEANPEHTVAWHEAIASIKEGVQNLPVVTRRVFLLSRFRNKTYPEIAAMLGISTRTVERKMSEAMEELASRIGEAL
jgi:RNA polymerase sigma-70 factor (ECF subfamily)